MVKARKDFTTESPASECKPEEYTIHRDERIYGEFTPRAKAVMEGIRWQSERNLNQPGDSPGERRARRFLANLLTLHPAGLRGRTKADFRRVCQQRFGISGRAFKHIWDWAVRQ